MLYKAFSSVYMKFKLHFYQKIFEKTADNTESLTTVETFCMEIIYALGHPTIAEFAKIANLSSPNAAYKIGNLVRKGYLKRVRNEEDKREFRLEVTDKYLDFYKASYNYMDLVIGRMQERFTDDEVKILERMLKVIDEELMPEIELKGE